jgi:hypothetical protein
LSINQQKPHFLRGSINTTVIQQEVCHALDHVCDSAGTEGD